MFDETNKFKKNLAKNIWSGEQDGNIKISKIAKELYKDIKFELKDGRGKLRLRKGEKWIDIGNYKTRTYKLTKYILGSSSKSKKIIDIFEYVKIKEDDNNEDLKNENPRSYGMKKEIIKRAVDELQREKYLKGHVSNLVFDDKKNTATIKLK